MREMKCCLCGEILHVGATRYIRVIKCPACAKKIADQVAQDFQDNIGHHMTEAILASADDKFLKLVSDSTKPTKTIGEVDADKDVE